VAILGQEGAKVAWALSANHDYKQAGGEGQLYITPTLEAKAATAEKFTCLAACALASDMDSTFSRQAVGLGAMYFGLTGSTRGNEEVGLYKSEAAAILRDLQTTTDVANLAIFGSFDPAITLP
jgi:hypothetical protein